ncbi:MAG: hypothetical protein KKB31_00535 [Nanoarchaeota archaeon]|nr:hypothetical protein [Nanoarchaeota archaeon]
MNDLVKFIIGTVVLIIGIPIGNFLAKLTKEELKDGQLWFHIIIIASFVGAILSLVWRNDVFLFSFLFIVIVTSRSLIVKKKK